MKEINSYGRLVIIAGPNGSGKSSVTIRLNKRRLLPDLYINPDDIAKEINSSDTGNVQIAAGREAVKLRESYLASGKSFAMETTLSGVSEISFIKKAIAHGYKVTAYFVAVQSVFGNILRVQNRVLKGGHDVPTQDIVRRRERSLQNLPFLIDNLPRVIVYDNSKNIRNFFRKNNNKITFIAKDLPEWFTSNISSEKIKEYRLEASLKSQSLNSSYLQEWRTLRNCIQNYDSNRNFDDEYVSDIHSLNSQPQCINQLSNNSNEPHKQGNKKLRGH